VYTYTGIDSVMTSTDTTAYGSFRLSDLPENIYSIKIVADDPVFLDTTINNLIVVRQQQKNAGAIRLNYK
jgi:hypothetical protein